MDQQSRFSRGCNLGKAAVLRTGEDIDLASGLGMAVVMDWKKRSGERKERKEICILEAAAGLRIALALAVEMIFCQNQHHRRTVARQLTA